MFRPFWDPPHLFWLINFFQNRPGNPIFTWIFCYFQSFTLYLNNDWELNFFYFEEVLLKLNFLQGYLLSKSLPQVESPKIPNFGFWPILEFSIFITSGSSYPSKWSARREKSIGGNQRSVPHLVCELELVQVASYSVSERSRVESTSKLKVLYLKIQT